MSTHRERIRTILAGEQPDQPVVDLGGRVASLSTPAYVELKSYLGFGNDLDHETVTILNTIGTFDERVLEYFDVPFRRIYLRPPSTFELTVAEDGSFYDEWGVKRQPRGPYIERIEYPMKEATLDTIEEFLWPDPHNAGRFDGLAEEVRHLYQNTSHSLAAGHISAGIFQDCWNLRGMEQFFEDLILHRDFAEALLDRVTEIHISLWDHFLNAVGEYVDIVETADDLAGQSSLLISPKMYRELVKPRHAALNRFLRQKTKAKILYHSCGAVMPLIDDLIDVGVDILNPIQPLSGLMDPEELKKRYGERLIFHGGLDVQSLLLTGAPEQVRKHVRHYLDVLGIDRFIMAPANSVQPGTPPENLIAAYEAAANYAKKISPHTE